MENLELTTQEFEPIVKQSGIEKAEIYAATFAPFMIKVKELSEKAASINKVNPSVLDAKLAREVRLAMVKNRTATGKKKDESKAILLAETNLIQNLHNIVINISTLAESELDAIEKYAENKEKERKIALSAERVSLLSPFLSDLTGYDLGGMSVDVFSDLLESQKLLFEQRKEAAAKLEAERIAAEKAEIERQAALKAENDRLKAEAELKEKELAEERAKADAERKAAELESKRIAEENTAKLQAEIDAKNKLEAELKAKADAERKAAEEAKRKQDAELKAKIEAEKKAAKAPDKEKIKSAIKSMPVFVVLELKTKDAQDVADSIREKYNGFISWANTLTESL